MDACQQKRLVLERKLVKHQPQTTSPSPATEWAFGGMKQQQIIKSVREELVSYIEENIKDYIDLEVSELHHNLFNTDYYIVGHYDAKQWIKSHDLDGLEVLNDVVEFEIDNFGEVSETRIKELTSYEKLVNNYVYWVGQEILNEVDCLSDNWDKFLTEEMADKVLQELISV